MVRPPPSRALSVAWLVALSACGHGPSTHPGDASPTALDGSLDASATDGDVDGSSNDAGMVADGGAGPFDAEPPFRFFHNRPVDARVASGPMADVVDLPSTLIGYLDRARTSVDLAVYEFSDSNGIAAALVRAKQRGVRVRLAMDHDNVVAAATNLGTLDAASIPWIDDAIGGQPSSALMHDKFVVIDGDVVWTGSYNLSDPGAYDDLQDVLVIHDAGVASAFTGQFEQMWGGSAELPDASAASFHNRKSDLGAHVFQVAGRTVELWFSPVDDAPNGGPMAHLRQAVATADASIDFHVFAFFDQTLADAMKARHDVGVVVRGVFEGIYWNAAYSEALDLRGLTATTTGTADPDPVPWSPAALVLADAEPHFLHAKSLIVDAAAPTSAPTVATGSFNWSDSANTANDENLVLVHDDAALANLFLQAVCGAYLRAGGSCVP